MAESIDSVEPVEVESTEEMSSPERTLEPMADWRLFRHRSDPSVLLVARDRDDEESRKVEVRRLALDAFDLYPEDLDVNYERVY